MMNILTGLGILIGLCFIVVIGAYIALKLQK